MRRLIITADDFGASVEVNEAVERAHREGLLTAASLMVSAPAAADAVRRAQRLPSLGVGLHIVLVCGTPILDPRDVPALVGSDGRFHDNLLWAGLRFFLLPAVRRQLAAEVRAQFNAFRATGLLLDHVNTHNHMHLHPTVSQTILSVGREFGMQAMRFPYEPCLMAEGEEARGALPSAAPVTDSLAIWLRLLKRRLDRAGMRYNDYVFGLHDSGHLDSVAVRAILSRLPPGDSEIYFHPAVSRESQPFPPDYAPDLEFAALVDQRLKSEIERAGIDRIAFRDLAATNA